MERVNPEYYELITADRVRAFIGHAAREMAQLVGRSAAWTLAADELSRWQAMGVERIGMSWEEVEAIEAEGYKAARRGLAEGCAETAASRGAGAVGE